MAEYKRKQPRSSAIVSPGTEGRALSFPGRVAASAEERRRAA
jgi:hypothetical protein